MAIVGHAVLFIFVGFAGFLFNSDRGSVLGIFLLIGLPVVGVYFLGWWALLTSLVGVIFGGRVFWGSYKTELTNHED